MNQLKKNIRFILSNELYAGRLSKALCLAMESYLSATTSDWNPELLLQLADETSLTLDILLRDDVELKASFPAGIKMLIFDVDGVMTDAGMYYTEAGDELKKFNARDGLAIRDLTKQGWLTGIISHGINVNLIRRRAELLGISHVYAGHRPKPDVLAEWCQQLGLSFEQVAFIGDDINDLPIIRIVGFSACPADALPEVKREVNLVLSSRGGAGAIREWIDRCFKN
ncbi:MAG: hypothetical protein RLZZ543_268 [Bacteroidota bacterium]|jgi:YrbI family 3-deoxy-D-manno-octulosonate 8-phosphate phosphatase